MPQCPNRQFLHRLDRANRFRTDRYRLRLSHVSCAKLLGVSVRTVQNWEAARARLPYAAYKLLRLLASGKHLDSAHWDGFYVQGDALVTPEGHRFQAGDLAWWSLAIRQAEAFRVLSRKQREMRHDVERGPLGNGRQDGGEGDALAPVASALMKQVRSEPSCFSGHGAKIEAQQVAASDPQRHNSGSSGQSASRRSRASKDPLISRDCGDPGKGSPILDPTPTPRANQLHSKHKPPAVPRKHRCVTNASVAWPRPDDHASVTVIAGDQVDGGDQ